MFAIGFDLVAILLIAKAGSSRHRTLASVFGTAELASPKRFRLQTSYLLGHLTLWMVVRIGRTGKLFWRILLHQLKNDLDGPLKLGIVAVTPRCRVEFNVVIGSNPAILYFPLFG